MAHGNAVQTFPQVTCEGFKITFITILVSPYFVCVSSNYRAIGLLNHAYKILSVILLGRIIDVVTFLANDNLAFVKEEAAGTTFCC